MLITDLTQSQQQTQTLSLKQVRAEARNWQVGNLLKAFVVSNTPKEGVTLNIQGQQYRVAPQPNQQNLQVGQRLNLEVMKTGEQPLLKVVQPQVQSREAIQNEGLRRNLPLQKPLGQLLNTLENLSKQSDNKQVSQQIRDISQRILSMLPNASKVSTPDGLKQAVRDSGHFLENKLMQLATNPSADKQSLQQDIKTGLLRLLDTLKANTPQQQPQQGQANPRPQGQNEPLVYNRPQTVVPQNAKTAPPPQTQASPTQTAAGEQRAINAAAQQNLNNPTPGTQAKTGPSMPNTTQAAPPQGSPPSQGAQQQTVQNPPPQAQAPRANIPAQGSEMPQPRVAPQPQPQGGNPVTAQQATSTPPPTTGEARPTITAPLQQENLNNLVGDIRKTVEAGIARIQTNQINSVRSEGIGDKPGMFLELPIRGQNNQVNVMQLNIQRDREAGGPDRPPIWSISLAFELVELGPIRAGMTLVGEHQLSLNIWAEDEATVALFDGEMGQLREGLQRAGFVTGHVGVQKGAPSSQEVISNIAQGQEGLLDLEV